MKARPLSLSVGAAVLTLISVQPLEAQVRTPDARMEILGKAQALVYPEFKSLEELTEAIVTHPFHPRSDVTLPGEAAEGLLARIASGISVDGTIQMGGVRYLLLQGRRVGPGDYLPVQYEGRTYQVRIEEVSASSYTLRLNDEEIEKNL